VARLDEVRAAMGPMRSLVATVGEAAYLARLVETGVLYLAVMQSPNTVRLTAQVGMLLPTHSTATGKVMLTRLSTSALSKRFEQPLAAFTVNTITRPADLRPELAQVRRQGFAITYDEQTVGSCSVAAPIRDYTGEVVAALAVSGPSYRLSRARLTTISRNVRATAAVISAALGSSRLSQRGRAS